MTAEGTPEDLRGEIAELKAVLKDAAGIDIDLLRKQREEQKEQAQRRQERFARAEKEHAAREEADRAEALRLWQEGVFVVDVGGKRIRAPKDLVVRCPHCRKEHPAVGGWLVDLLGAYRQCLNGTTFRLAGLPSFGPQWVGIPAIEDTITCPGCGDTLTIRMQMLTPPR